MALPTQLDLNYAFKGQPFLYTPAKTSIVLSGMNYSYKAEPFVGNELSNTTGWANKMIGIVGSNIGKINGVVRSSISKVNGV